MACNHGCPLRSVFSVTAQTLAKTRATVTCLDWKRQDHDGLKEDKYRDGWTVGDNVAGLSHGLVHMHFKRAFFLCDFHCFSFFFFCL